MEITTKEYHKGYQQGFKDAKKEYENRLKADLEAILTDLKLEIEELENPFGTRISGCSQDGWKHGVKNCDFVIQQKIDALKAESEDKENQDVDAI